MRRAYRPARPGRPPRRGGPGGSDGVGWASDGPPYANFSRLKRMAGIPEPFGWNPLWVERLRRWNGVEWVLRAGQGLLEKWSPQLSFAHPRGPGRMRAAGLG